MFDTFALNLDSPSFYFRILFWDQKKRKYVECIRLNFNEDARDIMLHLHGHLSCPFVQNADHGNMFRYKYELLPDETLNIEVLPKSIRTFVTTIASKEQHSRKCKYVQQDKEGDFKYFTEFEPPGLPPLFERP